MLPTRLHHRCGRHAYSCDRGMAHYGSITRLDDLKPTWPSTAPRGFGRLQPELFEVFLVERRRLMAQKIKQYYWGVRAHGRVVAACRRVQG